MGESDNTQITSISKAHTLEEIAEFGDAHSLADYWDQTREVKVKARRMDTGVSTRDAGHDEDLSRVREGWAEIEALETRLLHQMTVQESLRHYLALQRAFESQLQRTEPLFRAERLAYLEGLQRRLARLGRWMEEQRGKPL